VRLGAGVPKALIEVAGETLIERAVRGLNNIAGTIIVAAPAGYEDQFRQILSHPSIEVITGGKVRSESVANALQVIPTTVKYLLVHDAARAFTPLNLTERVLAALIAGEQAVVPALDVVDTIKVVDSWGYVEATPDRERLRAVQTPQGFTREVLVAAHATGGTATDDAALVAALGIPVKVIPGDLLARKITTHDDLLWARELVGQP
jgi:2-C-methyl-D-erythritol 4-phosphate cytidylyltransferase